MKRIGLASACCVLLTALGLSSPGEADPLHKLGREGAWVHVDSGWVFPMEVGGFARVAQPYNIDGNNDAGAEYRQASGSSAEVEIYAADSGATGATLEGAKGNATVKAGKSAHITSEMPFEVEALRGENGVKITYLTDEKSAGTLTNLYFFTTDRWRVKVLARTQDLGKDGDLALDTFVRTLPWKTLGTDPGLH